MWIRVAKSHACASSRLSSPTLKVAAKGAGRGTAPTEAGAVDTYAPKNYVTRRSRGQCRRGADRKWSDARRSLPYTGRSLRPRGAGSWPARVSDARGGKKTRTSERRDCFM
ncbi:unnamed protein product, partial [Iphiclides podalirius]